MTEAEKQAERHENEVLSYMEELECDRETAEILVEQSIGANPDAWWPDTDYSNYIPQPLCD